MISLRDIFLAMQSIYENAQLAGWQTIYVSPDTEIEGLRIACYLNSENTEALIVFRGTVPSNIYTLRDDLILALKQMPISFERAREVDSHIRGILPRECRITYLGHSLGAIHASLFACLHRTGAMTYDNPGIGGLLKADAQLDQGASHPNTRIINFLSAPNLVNTLHPQSGQCYRVYIGLNTGMSSAHIAKSTLGAIKQVGDSEIFRTLSPGTSQFMLTVGHGISRLASASIPGGVLMTANYAAWLLRQHSIDNLVAELASEPYQFLRLGKVVSWPNLDLTLTRVTSIETLLQLSDDAIPTEGLHTLSARAELKILESRLAKIEQYQVQPMESHELRREEAKILSFIFPTSAHARSASSLVSISGADDLLSLADPIVQPSHLSHTRRTTMKIRIRFVQEGQASEEVDPIDLELDVATIQELRESLRNDPRTAQFADCKFTSIDDDESIEDDEAISACGVSKKNREEFDKKYPGTVLYLQVTSLKEKLRHKNINTLDGGSSMSDLLMRQDQEMRALRLSARAFLGFGYDRVENKIGQRVLRVPPDTEITITDQRDIAGQKVWANTSSAQHELKKAFNVEFSIPLPHVSVGAAVGSSDRHVAHNSSDEIVCSFAHFKQARCSLSRIPSFSEEELAGSWDACVRSGLVYVGYVAHIIMKIVSHKNEEETEKHANLGVEYEGIAKFSAKGESLDHALKDKRITEISVEVIGVGGYQPRRKRYRFFNLEDVFGEFSRIDREFPENLPSLQARSYHIDPHPDARDLLEFSSIPRTAPKLESFQLLTQQPSTPQQQEIQSRILYNLGKRIEERLPLEVRKSLGPHLRMPLVLANLYDFFPKESAVSIQNDGKKNILILGKSGVGKSTLAAKLLGYNLGINEDEKVDYKIKPQVENYPIIGHLDSETKGVNSYDSDRSMFVWHDCAGILDTISEQVTNFCNATVLSVMMQYAPPSGLLIVLSPSLFLEDDRAVEVSKLIDNLRRCVKNPTDPEKWKSILFVINPHNPIYNRAGNRLSPDALKEAIIEKIQWNINIFEEAIKKKLPVRVFNWIKNKMGWSSATVEERIEEYKVEMQELHKTQPLVVEQLQENLTRIEILNLFIKNSDNVIIADVLDDGQTQQKIERALCKSSLSREDFTPEHLYGANYHVQFNVIMHSIVSYFNQICKEISDLDLKILNTRCMLEYNIKEAEESQARILEHGSGSSCSPEQLEKIEQRIRENDLEIERLKSEKATKENEIVELEESEDPVELPAIHPVNPIQTRSMWAYFNWQAREYPFEYDGSGVPFLEVTGRILTEKGRFKCYEYQPENGVYKASYLPMWYGHSEDRDAKIIVKIRKKHHTSTITRVGVLRNELSRENGIEASIRNLETRREGLRSRKHTTLAIEWAEQMTKEYREIIRQNDQYGQAQNKLLAIVRQDFGFFCLVKLIIETLELNLKTVIPIEREDYGQFVEYVQWLEREGFGRFLEHRMSTYGEFKKSGLFDHMPPVPPRVDYLPTSQVSLKSEAYYQATIDGIEKMFCMDQAPGDGDCAFHTLATNRQFVVSIFLKYKNNLDVREQFWPEIAQIIQAPANIFEEALAAQLTTDSFKESLRQYHKTQKKLNDLRSGVEPAQDEIESIEAEIAQMEADILQYCKSEEVFINYIIHGFGGRLWLSYEGILLYAKDQKITVYILGDDEEKNKLKIIRQYQAENSSNVIYMLHTENHSHFNFLYVSVTM